MMDYTVEGNTKYKSMSRVKQSDSKLASGKTCLILVYCSATIQIRMAQQNTRKIHGSV